MEKNGTLASPATGFREQGFPAPGRPDEQHALWGISATQLGEFFGIPEEFDDFLELFFGFVDARNVFEGDHLVRPG